VYFDLGDDYVIRKIYLHDMNNVANLDVSYGTPNNWTPLFTEPCNSYIKWKLHETNISTRYIQLTMANSVYAAVNEIAIYGYIDYTKKFPVANPYEFPEEVSIFPNPCNSTLTISNLGSMQHIELVSITGTLVLSSTQSQVDTGNVPPGIYLLNVREQNGNIAVRKKVVISH
jgi:hypothetical protein